MLPLLIDEDFNRDIIRGALRLEPRLDFVWVEEVGLKSSDDEIILAWAAEQRRVLITHDIRTMVGHAYARVAQAHSMPGVIAVRQLLSLGLAIEQLLITVICLEPSEINSQVRFIPL